MATRLVNIDRDTPMLLPPSIHDWLEADDPARLVVDLVHTIDLSKARVNERGTGSRQYPPSMMLALLLYCYSGGFFSSREIEALTRHHVGVRYICANEHPDHDTICKFRRENGELIRDAFAQSLQLASRVGILKIGEIDAATDGTRMQGNLSSSQSRTVEEIDEEIDALEEGCRNIQQTIDGLLEQAEQADRRDARQDREPLSEELSDPARRRELLREAQEEIRRKERRRARLEAAKHSWRETKARKSAAREAEREEIRGSDIGRVPNPREGEVKDSDRVNVTDPESIKMKGNKGGWPEGYNAQSSVDMESGLVVGARAVDEASDTHELEGNVAEIEANLGAGAVRAMPCDTGYDNTYQIARIEREGGPRMICQQRRPKAGTEGPAPKKTPRGRELRTREKRDRYYERLREPENRALLRRRRETVEPSYGIIREQMGFRRFSLRGREKADTEWRLVNFGFNLRKLSRDHRWKQWLCGNRNPTGMN